MAAFPNTTNLSRRKLIAAAGAGVVWINFPKARASLPEADPKAVLLSMENTIAELESHGYWPMANVWNGEINGLTMGYLDPRNPSSPRTEACWDGWHEFTATDELRRAMSDHLFATGRINGLVY